LKIKNRLEDIYKIAPYYSLIKNRFQIFFFFLFSQNSVELKLKNGLKINVNKNKIYVLPSFLHVIKNSVELSKKSDERLEISFDGKNKFTISTDLSLPDNVRLLLLFHYGIKYGVYFQEGSSRMLVPYNKSIKILEEKNKIILETSQGLRFFLDSIDPFIIIETFILRIHKVDFFDTLKGKIIVDIGANAGDTALFFAQEGAKVYAFEPVLAHFEAMLKNISLNQNLAERIIPINAAIGEDGILKIHQSNQMEIAGGASLFYEPYGTEEKILEVEGYSLNSAFKKFGINNVDFLKMDCKGCEFFLDDENLKNVKNIKIEYTTFNSHKLADLILILKRNGYEIINYLQNPESKMAIEHHGTLLALKPE